MMEGNIALPATIDVINSVARKICAHTLTVSDAVYLRRAENTVFMEICQCPGLVQVSSGQILRKGCVVDGLHIHVIEDL